MHVKDNQDDNQLILDNDSIEKILTTNIQQIFEQKLTKIDKTKFDDIANNGATKLTDTEISHLIISDLIFEKLIVLSVKPINEQNSKKFTANINVKKWDEVIKNNELNDELVKEHTEAKEFLKKNDEEKKDEVREEMQGMNEEEIEQTVTNKIRISNEILKINLDSVKSMYDLIIETSKTIEIDLTDKQ